MFNRSKEVHSGSSDLRAALAAEMQQVLRRHVMDAWFPRCLDEELGGFHSSFDRQWRRIGSTDRMLEFQARQTRVCAELALAFPEEGRWQEYAMHGFRFFRDRMWDRKHGGWFWMVSGDGEPLAGGTKHAHSGAYAVQAASVLFRATGERAALEHAEEGFDWFDRHAHDPQFGGFHTWLTREGAVIRTMEQVPAGAGIADPLSHDVGTKDVNVHGDWFETLLEFTASSDSARGLALLEEFAGIYLNQVVTREGEVQYGFHDDWTPQPGPEWYGYGFTATHRFLAGAKVLPAFPDMEARARVTMLHTIRRARLKRGGFCYAGPAGEPVSLEGHDLRVPARAWWVQFEALRVLALYAKAEETPGPYFRAFGSHWDFIKSNLIDEREGGTYHRPAADWRPWVRTWLPRQGWAFRKGDHWKDASHETVCLLGSIAALSGEMAGPAGPSPTS